jgi:hypothetical protein
MAKPAAFSSPLKAIRDVLRGARHAEAFEQHEVAEMQREIQWEHRKEQILGTAFANLLAQYGLELMHEDADGVRKHATIIAHVCSELADFILTHQLKDVNALLCAHPLKAAGLEHYLKSETGGTGAQGVETDLRADYERMKSLKDILSAQVTLLHDMIGAVRSANEIKLGDFFEHLKAKLAQERVCLEDLARSEDETVRVRIDSWIVDLQQRMKTLSVEGHEAP